MPSSDLVHQALEAYSRKDWARAVELLTGCVEAGHASQAVLLRLAQGHVALAQWPEAERRLREAAAANPRDAHPVYLLGQLHERLGRLHEALADYQQAHGLNPAHVPSREAVLRLRPAPAAPAAPPAGPLAGPPDGAADEGEREPRTEGPPAPWQVGGVPVGVPYQGRARELPEPPEGKCRLRRLDLGSLVVFATGPVLIIGLLLALPLFGLGLVYVHEGVALLLVFESVVVWPLSAAFGAWIAGLIFNWAARVCGGIVVTVQRDRYTMVVRRIAPWSFAKHLTVQYALSFVASATLLLFCGALLTVVAPRELAGPLAFLVAKLVVLLAWSTALCLPAALLGCLLQAALYNLYANWLRGVCVYTQPVGDELQVQSFHVWDSAFIGAAIGLTLQAPWLLSSFVALAHHRLRGLEAGVTTVALGVLTVVLTNVVVFWCYNVLAGWLGGLKVTFEQEA